MSRAQDIAVPRTLTPVRRQLAGELEHAVQLYETEDYLCDVVADFVAEGFAREEPVVVIATAAHRDAIAERVAARGYPIESALSARMLALLDAREMLDKILVEGTLSWTRFRSEIGDLLETMSARSGGRIRAYGEMVDLLWRDGRTSTAVQLEEMWNVLHGKGDLTLLCAYVVGGLYKQTDLAAVCGAHACVMSSESDGSDAPSNIERALREALREIIVDNAHAETLGRKLSLITDALPALVAYIDRDQRYRFVNAAYQRWFGMSAGELLGKHVADAFGDDAHAAVASQMATALEGETVVFRTHIDYRRGGPRTIEATYTPDRAPDGTVRGIVALVNDISQQARLEAQRDAAIRRAERLLEITSAIAQAVTTDQVLDALSARVADALGADTVGVWFSGAEGIRLARARGYGADLVEQLDLLAATGEGSLPAVAAARSGMPIWLDSPEDMVARYPQLDSCVTPGAAYRIACLPIAAESRTIGSLGLTFAPHVQLDDEHRAFLMLVATYCGQALERVRLLDAERASRLAAEAARANMEHLHRLAARVIGAREVGDVYDAALDAIAAVLGTPRAAVLLHDATGVMRFAAARGLSEEYKRGVEGHSPWDRDDTSPVPVLVRDVRDETALAGYTGLLRRENIASLGFFPLLDGGSLVGKFMVYYERPRELSRGERDMATAIANHVAAGVARFAAMERERATARQVLRAATRLTELQEATSRLASALTMGDVAEVVLNVTEATLGATAGVVYLTGIDGELRLAGWRGPASRSLPEELSLDAPYPLADAARGRRPVFITAYAELVARYPNIDDVPANQLQAVAGLPLVHAGELLGGFALSFHDRERLDTGAQQWLLSFASQAALAVERARAYEAEQSARSQAETLYRIADSLSATQLDLDAAAITDRSALRTVLQRCCDLLVERSEIALARIWTVNAAGALEPQASAVLPAYLQRDTADRDLQALAAEIAQRKRPHITRELALFPLTVDEKLVGVMALRAQFPSVTDTLEQLGSSARTIAIGIERLRIHADRERLVEELERTVRFNETFAGMLGHDLRNPLGSMVTGTQLVLLRTTDEKITGPLGRVLSAGDRMTRMIDQLLDFTRARVGGGLAIQPRATNLRQLVDQAVEEVAVAHPAWKFDVETTGDTTGSWDADRLTQVFSNLLGNAVQHGVQQVPIKVAIDGTIDGQIAVTLWNGGAIPVELLPILFEPFRGSRHKRNGSKGLGLGLFITQQIIRAHGGDIAVASTLEAGTSFTIHLPRKTS